MSKELDRYIGNRLQIGEFIYKITGVKETAGGLYFDCDRYSQSTGKTGKVIALHESTLFEINNSERNGKNSRSAKPLFEVLE